MTDFIGIPGDDVFSGTGSNDSYRLEAGGNDQASGLDGNDGFYFGTALTGADIVDGGLGIDTVAIQGDYVSLALGAITNVEVLLIASGHDTRFGDTAGNSYDYVIATADANIAAGAILTLIASDLLADESLTFNGAAETNGNFRVFAGRGTDRLTGGSGNDGFFFGADGNLTGADRIDGGAGTDSIALRGNYSGGRAVTFDEQSFTGIEVIVLLSGHSAEFGGVITPGGFDYDLTFTDANVAFWQRLDIIAGNLRANESVRIDASAEANGGGFRIIAGAGDDRLIGGAGDDQIYGGLGADTLTGGGAGDRFGFTSEIGGGNVDTITDFETRWDRIELSGAIFSALATGELGSAWLGFGAEATEGSHRVVFNAATGGLLYDADGAGGVAAVQFATINFKSAPDGSFDNPFLSSANFFVSGAANRAPTIAAGNSTIFAENIDAATVVFDAAATDPDGDAVAYYLFGADAAAATIDRATGEVRLKASPDHEAQSEYRFELGVADSSGQMTYKAIGVRITDVLETLSSTPVIAEAAGDNDSFAGVQTIARTSLGIAPNVDLTDEALASATIAGAISSPSDRDRYKIEMKKGELLILDIDHSGGTLDSVVRLYNPRKQTEIANDDAEFADAGSDPHPTYDHGTDSYLRFRAPEDGEYFFWVESFQDPSRPTSGSYQLNISLGPVASAAEIWAEDIQAMLSGNAWGSTALSYAFPTSIGHYPTGIDETDEPGEFAPLNAAQQTAVNQALQQIAAVSGLTFSVAAEPGEADLRYAMSDEAEVAYAYYPTHDQLGGTAWFNKVDFNQPVLGGYEWMGFLHETGHTLGLKHGQDWPNLSFDHDSLEYTVMTYRSYAGAPIHELNGYLNETWSYPQSLMMLDIAALQALYGANFETNSGDTVYRWSAATGEQFVNGIGQGVPGGSRIFMTVWDGGGVDTYDFSGSDASIIDLRPGEWSTIPFLAAQLSQGGARARGTVANALLYEDDPRSLIENAIGSSDSNGFIGNRAKNVFIGGGGMDSYSWYAIEDIGLGATADEIMDWRWGPSRINLREIDAVSDSWMDDAFTLIGTNAFSGKAGELRYDLTSDGFRLSGDVNGDAFADFEIIVHKFDPLEPLALDMMIVL